MIIADTKYHVKCQVKKSEMPIPGPDVLHSWLLKLDSCMEVHTKLHIEVNG